MKKITFYDTDGRKDYLCSLVQNRKVFTEDEAEQLIDKGFLTAPASAHHHGAYEGGLFDHSVNVANVLESLTTNLGLYWSHPLSPQRVGILHDLCKLDQYRRLGSDHYEYNQKTLYPGHGIKSALIAGQITRLTEEERACIVYHMGAFVDKDQIKYYDNAIQVFPNVLWTHTADMVASQIFGV